MTKRLTLAERAVLATVALSHAASCRCEAACLPLKLDDERKAEASGEGA